MEECRPRRRHHHLLLAAAEAEVVVLAPWLLSRTVKSSPIQKRVNGVDGVGGWKGFGSSPKRVWG
jgi:hypothetical protein